MKVPVLFAAFALLCVPMVSNAYGQAASSSGPACDGVINVVRLSEITPTGSMDKFAAAVAAHQAWYKSHGLPDVIFAARIVVHDSKTKADSYSETQMLTYHYQKPGGMDVKHDAAWDAYVKLYNDTSSIKQTYVNCVPATYAPASLK